jgi:HPr kinase/phosphorylase
VADDAVEIKKVAYNMLIGSAPEVIRYYVELRGIGVIDVRKLFGMGAVKDQEKIDMIINIEAWQDGYMYDRLGLENAYTEILGVKLPYLLLPIHPGRNLAVVLEVAARNQRLKQMGFNAANELTRRHMEKAMREAAEE